MIHSSIDSASLKPCPFCGAAAVKTLSSDGRSFWICCTNDSCDIQPCIESIDAKRAEEGWNRRA